MYWLFRLNWAIKLIPNKGRYVILIDAHRMKIQGGRVGSFYKNSGQGVHDIVKTCGFLCLIPLLLSSFWKLSTPLSLPLVCIYCSPPAPLCYGTMDVSHFRSNRKATLLCCTYITTFKFLLNGDFWSHLIQHMFHLIKVFFQELCMDKNRT